MVRLDRLLLGPILAIAAVGLACGAAAAPPPAVHGDAPGGAPKPALADEPLVKGPLETDADLARAIREYYTKYEHRVPMRDGTRLFTSVYVPKDPQHTYPILLMRTPYAVDPYGVDVYPAEKGRMVRRLAPSVQLLREGYIFAHQDVRGRMMSEGAFVDVRPLGQKPNESTDAYDTIDWLVKNVPQNSGKVGTWGISYPGFYAAQSAVDAHPALKAVSPQAPVTDWFLGDDFHHNGVLFLADAFHFYSAFGKPRPEPTKKFASADHHPFEDGYEFFLAMGPLANANAKYLKGEIPFWNDLMSHDVRDDFWKARDPRPSYRDAKPAVMTVGGFYDAEDLWGALATYRAFEAQSPRSENLLVMGPWRHGGWARNDGDRLGDISFGQKTSLFYRDHIEQPFFQRHLKGRKLPAPPEAWIFETGTNLWRAYAKWPPPSAKPATLYFGEGGKLGTTGPTGADGDDAYVSDPAKPVPYRAKPSERIDAEYMSEDQRFASRRPDVLVYASPPLDGDVTLTGPIAVTLWVSTTGTDADFVVKLVDVWPSGAPEPEPNPTGAHWGGYQELVRAEIMRASFRASFEKPQAMKPNEPAKVTFTLPDVAHAFRTGHRLMVQVQSSWFPLAERNPQTFVDRAKAAEADYKSATHRVYRRKEMASKIDVGVALGELPK